MPTRKARWITGLYDDVAARTAFDVVIASTAVQRVIVLGAMNVVVPGAALDVVIALAAGQAVALTMTSATTRSMVPVSLDSWCHIFIFRILGPLVISCCRTAESTTRLRWANHGRQSVIPRPELSS